MDKKEYINIFYEYAQQDGDLRQSLTKHLRGKERHRGHIKHHYEVSVGDDQEKEIKRMIEEADIILLLISADFNDIWYTSPDREQILERHNAKEDMYVFPILLRPCDWEDGVFSKRKALPRDGKAVTITAGEQIGGQDQTFRGIAADIGVKFDSILKKKYKRAAERYIADKQDEEALKAYEEAIKFDTQLDDAHLHQAMGVLLNKLKLFEKAYEAYEKATRINPHDAQLWMDKGNFLASQGRYAEALEAYNAAGERAINNVAVFIGQGNAHFALGHNKEARKLYAEAKKLDPQHAFIYDEKIGDTLLKERECKEARKSYLSAINAAPKNTSFLYKKIGDAFFMEAKDEKISADQNQLYKDALEAYNKSLSAYDNVVLNGDEDASERDFGHTQIYGSKARVLSLLARYDEALSTYNEALDHYAQNTYRSVLCKECGDIYARLGRFNEAIDAYDYAIALNRNFRLAFINKAKVIEEEANKTYTVDCQQAEAVYTRTVYQAQAKRDEKLQLANEALHEAERLVNNKLR